MSYGSSEFLLINEPYPFSAEHIIIVLTWEWKEDKRVTLDAVTQFGGNAGAGNGQMGRRKTADIKTENL